MTRKALLLIGLALTALILYVGNSWRRASGCWIARHVSCLDWNNYQKWKDRNP